ncbi:hypothetical protein CHGG_09916 [Chaetomium globosum CBS 148.51]|uniref:Oligopeptide transporter n=1 Tax=Chaetomium globosum (strain ATCC 6205 / CBS 148.51 / DSM 1962 / NBRC 6347 / NRRL 1970) TaxID=306901 RepID=Q2GQ38_CHAGB|nr:uncharacterized protein CHGG_09916 [Chaetomium globosum CBS 148.51]EAQ83512.1 hypothetical protein CHGG_09916 [Chaetomium globosum CBS 148.51]
MVQTTAVAAGGMSTIFVSAFPAMYQLGLLTDPAADYWRLVTLTAGVVRRFFVLEAARDLHLVFPTPLATAITIRDMHQASAEGPTGRTTRRKMRILGWTFGLASALRVGSQFAVGILWDWHPFTWYSYLVPSSGTALGLESWGWYIEWSPAFIGTGMLVGMHAAVNYFAGSLLAWGLIGPYLVSCGSAFGSEIPGTGLVSYVNFSADYTTASHPSPRYWLLGPGVACMVAVSLTEMACQWRALLYPIRAIWKKPDDASSSSSKSTDPFPSSNQVPTYLWLPGFLLTILHGSWVMNTQYAMPLLTSLLAFLLAMVLSFLTTQATGATDITPVTAASTSSQVTLSALSSSQGLAPPTIQRFGLLGGALSALGAMQSADLTGDFRVGFLLRTSPRKQWIAQCIGTLFACVVAPGLYVLFSEAYPCVNQTAFSSGGETGSGKCPFQVPTASAWRAIALATTDPDAGGMPESSRIFAVVFAAVGSASVLVRHGLWNGKWEWVRGWHPNFMLVSLGFIIPATVYSTAMLMGAWGARWWSRKSPETFGKYGYAVIAGLTMGEGVGGVVNAVMQVVGLSGEKWGTVVGCPWGRC